MSSSPLPPDAPDIWVDAAKAAPLGAAAFLARGLLSQERLSWGYLARSGFSAAIVAVVVGMAIRDHIEQKLAHAGLSDITIQRRGEVEVDIHTARPGIVIRRSPSFQTKSSRDLSSASKRVTRTRLGRDRVVHGSLRRALSLRHNTAPTLSIGQRTRISTPTRPNRVGRHTLTRGLATVDLDDHGNLAD